MKNLLLSFVFVLINVAQSFSQEFINSFANEFGTWSDYSQTWIWSDVNRVEINFILQGNIILSNDKAKSTYITSNDAHVDGNTYTWSAVDEKGRDCLIIMSVINGYDCLVILYDDLCYRYYY